MDKPAFFNRVSGERRLGSKLSLLTESCLDKDVLDVGCVGQATDFNDPRWLHAKLREKARSLVGVDLDDAGLERVRGLGFDVVHPRDLEASGRDFDVVVMGDVIEHADDPVAMLRFYGGFLREGGRLLVTTPNPFGAIHALRILRNNRIRVNPDHTMWIDPYTFTELARRAGLDICDFAWISDYVDAEATGRSGWLMLQASRMLSSLRRFYSANYFVALERRSRTQDTL